MGLFKVGLFCSCVLSAVYITGGEEPKCKFPAQWQSNVFFDLGMMMILPRQANGSGVFYYDYTNKQMRFDLAGIEHANNVTFDYTIIWKFNESAFYTVDHVNKTCEREVGISDFWEQWEGLPADSSPEHFGYVGSLKDVVGQYHLVRNVGEPTGNVSISIDVLTGDVCPPLRLSFRDLGVAPFGTFTYYYEFLDVTDITNPKVFTPPPHCQNITLPYNPHRKQSLPRHLGLFMV